MLTGHTEETSGNITCAVEAEAPPKTFYGNNHFSSDIALFFNFTVYLMEPKITFYKSNKHRDGIGWTAVRRLLVNILAIQTAVNPTRK